MWVVAAAEVNPAAITTAANTVAAIFDAHPRLAPAIAGANIRLGIIGANQRLTEMPEYRDLYRAFPGTDWDRRARGLGATTDRPLVSAGEENILCSSSDRYLGEDILLHEFSHVLHQFGFAPLEPDFAPRLDAAYQAAMDRGTWNQTYAATNASEYWAEGVQSYFARNHGFDTPDGIHGPIDTRGELANADPALFDLIDERLSAAALPPMCG